MAQCRRRGGDRNRGARSRQPDGLSLILEFRFLRLERVSEASLGTARAQRLRLRGMRRPADRPGGLDSRPDAAVRIGEARLVKGCGAGEESRRYGLARARGTASSSKTRSMPGPGTGAAVTMLPSRLRQESAVLISPAAGPKISVERKSRRMRPSRLSTSAASAWA